MTQPLRSTKKWWSFRGIRLLKKSLLDIPPGEYEIFCLPLKIKGADGAPARILLRG